MERYDEFDDLINDDSGKKKKIIIISVIVVCVAAVLAGVFFAKTHSRNNDASTTTTTEAFTVTVQSDADITVKSGHYEKNTDIMSLVNDKNVNRSEEAMESFTNSTK